jgi:hypothetical protein
MLKFYDKKTDIILFLSAFQAVWRLVHTSCDFSLYFRPFTTMCTLHVISLCVSGCLPPCAHFMWFLSVFQAVYRHVHTSCDFSLYFRLFTTMCTLHVISLYFRLFTAMCTLHVISLCISGCLPPCAHFMWFLYFRLFTTMCTLQVISLCISGCLPPCAHFMWFLSVFKAVYRHVHTSCDFSLSAWPRSGVPTVHALCYAYVVLYRWIESNCLYCHWKVHRKSFSVM